MTAYLTILHPAKESKPLGTDFIITTATTLRALCELHCRTFKHAEQTSSFIYATAFISVQVNIVNMIILPMNYTLHMPPGQEFKSFLCRCTTMCHVSAWFDETAALDAPFIRRCMRVTERVKDMSDWMKKEMELRQRWRQTELNTSIFYAWNTDTVLMSATTLTWCVMLQKIEVIMGPNKQYRMWWSCFANS